MTHPDPSALVVTRATRADWPVISGWAAAEGWNPGVSDGDAFFAQDPRGFFLGRIDGEPVSAISVVNQGADYAFLGCYLVRPDQRGRGHGIATWNAGLAHAGTRTVGLDGVVAQQDNYRMSGFRSVHRTIRYAGTAPETAPASGVRPVVPGDLPAIFAYDRECVPADRPGFLTAWFTTEGHRAYVRHDGHRATGVGVLRPALEGLRVGPLFADTEADARALFAALLDGAAGQRIAIDVPEPNALAVKLAEEAGLQPCFETARMYSGPVREHAGERVFGSATLELG
ncbi:GNAT family N-acetyltransferase [Streptomyces sp. J2-1]|uniref:GNAT family N-acetyltransferase n=1 Tax=Streptomyces corallincola TaxID=2851888 RepID=UPI001C39394E|nr:GNAT family N-acetyltransferase [Streptomyces corallincola]MBV2352987.1 GNAT family N-acetyltransferase [Streptomyces corallincola]